MFRLRFPESQVTWWAERYSYPEDEDLRKVIRPVVRARGYLRKAEFLRVCEWKTPRTRPRCAGNDEFAIRTVTRAALATRDESLKMDLLRTLAGVSWPTASTLLHFCDRRPYPILDYRALWSLGFLRPPHYTMDFWLEYLAFTRGLARRLKVDIRTLDRALWQYSKVREGGGAA